MAFWRPLVVILLLLNLGLLLGSEAFAVRPHADPSSDCASLSAVSDCADPCHVGQTHFGHGTFAWPKPDLGLIQFVEKTSLVSAESRRFEAPLLEGPRRPPRAQSRG